MTDREPNPTNHAPTDLPELTDPVVVAAFEGWNDAGDAASSAIEHLQLTWDATPLTELDPDPYYDFQVSPILATVDGRRAVFGAGKGGRVVAWDRIAHTRLWSRAVGVHLNDLGSLPVQQKTVCPGLLGGVLTPMAYAAGRLFVPVVDLWSTSSRHRAFRATA